MNKGQEHASFKLCGGGARRLSSYDSAACKWISRAALREVSGSLVVPHDAFHVDENS